jgi:hypothetical protein
MYGVNSMATELQVEKMYIKLMNCYENLMVELKYNNKFSNTQIKKEMNRLNKFYLNEFFKRAK